MKKTIVILFCTYLISACSAFTVHDKDGFNKKGIPFYLKTGVVKQTTAYTRSWIEATIEYHKIKEDKNISGSDRSATIPISEATYNKIELLKSFAQADTSAKNGFGAAIETFQSRIKESCGRGVNCEISQEVITKESSPTNTEPKSLLQALESNSSVYEAIVDYENPYYFNATVPPFGTTTATTKLASDGTLTEVSSTVDSTKLAELIPLKELLLDKLGLAKILKDGTAKDYSLTLSISVNGYQYTLTKYHPYRIGLNLEQLLFSTKDISIERVKYGTAPTKTDERKKKAITIEGSIVLPEDK